jgi:hypothetical protein
MNTAFYYSSVGRLLMIGIFSMLLIACGKEDFSDPAAGRYFTVTIKNVSNHQTLQTGALPNRTAPVGNGIWAVVSTRDLFEMKQPADEGTSRLAEDCFTHYKLSAMDEEPFVKRFGEFSAPGGPDNDVALYAGEETSFTVMAEPGDKLQIQTMFIQSNDWFYSFRDGGLNLFNGEEPIEGDVTSELVLLDAGTEADEMPGIGDYQKLDQDPSETDFGPNDPIPFVKEAVQTHTTLVIPPTSAVLQVTVTAKRNGQ